MRPQQALPTFGDETGFGVQTQLCRVVVCGSRAGRFLCLKAAGGDSCISIHSCLLSCSLCHPPPQTTGCQCVWLFVCFDISSLVFTSAASCLPGKKKKRRKKKKALVCSGRGASEMNVLPPLCSHCRNGQSNQSDTVCLSWAAWTSHIATHPWSLRPPPSCSSLLSLPLLAEGPCCSRARLGVHAL